VVDLLKEIGSRLIRRPQVMAALTVAAEGAHFHPGILDFSYLPALPKHVSHLFTLEAIRGCGMGELAEFKQEGEWCSPGRLWSSCSP
jgi:hypothetical protein